MSIPDFLIYMKVLSKILIFLTFVYVALLGYSLAWSSELIEPTRTLELSSDSPGKLSVFSEPPGLDVALDGSGIGKTPIISKIVEPGTYVLRVNSEETEIYIGPGKDLRLSLHKGAFIEIPPERREVRQQKQTGDMKTRKNPKSKQTKEKKEELNHLYWPLDPGGPIY